MEGVCLEDPVQGLLPLLKPKLGVLWEGAVDVTAYDLIYLFLTYTDLQQSVVARVLRELKGDGPLHSHYRIHQACKAWDNIG